MILDDRNGPWLSVIVPAHNGARTLAACLAAVRRELAGGEVICVDDASADDGAAIAAAAGAKVIRTAENVGAARARNRGAAAACGRYLLFLDADVILLPGALAALARAFNGDVDAVVGHYTALTPAAGFFSRYQNFYTFYNHDRQDGAINWFWTAVGAVRGDVFKQLGGFREHFRGASAEDMQFGYELSRAGFHIVLDKDVRGVHDHVHTFFSLIRNDLKKSAAWTNVFLRLNRRGEYEHGFTGAANRVSLVAAFIVVVALAASWWLGRFGVALAAGAGTVFIVVNAPFYNFMARRAGPAFLLGAVPFHLFTYVLIGLGIARGAVSYLFGAKVK